MVTLHYLLRKIDLEMLPHLKTNPQGKEDEENNSFISIVCEVNVTSEKVSDARTLIYRYR